MAEQRRPAWLPSISRASVKERRQERTVCHHVAEPGTVACTPTIDQNRCHDLSISAASACTSVGLSFLKGNREKNGV